MAARAGENLMEGDELMKTLTSQSMQTSTRLSSPKG
jgi:hypothetical protein